MLRPVRLAILSLLLLALLPACRPGAALAVGQAAPDFSLPDLDGQTHTLAEYRGKVVVLEWINPGCPFSHRTAEEGVMIDTLARHPGVVWLGINSTAKSRGDYRSPAEHKKYDARYNITYPVLYDTAGTVGHAYGATTTPHMFVVDEQGKLIYEGAIDDDPGGSEPKAKRTNYVDLALAAHAAGRTPDPATTKSWGCSVKY